MSDLRRVACAIIGSGNIGTDLIYKLKRSAALEPVWMVGIDPASDGLARARMLGLRTTHQGVDGLLPHVAQDRVRIAFDATSAYVHAANSRQLTAAGVLMIDLTPAAIGPFCCPPVNLAAIAAAGATNVNMISCGGQATIPMVHAVARVQAVSYAEIVATAASRSIGPGTRANLDEFTHTTSRAVAEVGGARRGKALVVVNPAEPPLMMRDTIYCLTEDEPRQEEIRASVASMLAEVQRYVPGYTLVNGPVFDGRKVSIFIRVEGLGDYLPKYAGNLDIMTAAAVRTAELLAERMTGAQSAPAAYSQEVA